MTEPIPERVQIGDSVLYQNLREEMVLLNMSNQQYYGLNDVGSRMWELLLELPSISAVVEQLTTEFDIDRVSVRADLESLVTKMLKTGLLRAA